MARTLSNNAALQCAREDGLATLPVSPSWLRLQPNSFAMGADVAKTYRNFISKTRRRRKGSVTDLKSAVRVDCDVTREHLEEFTESALLALSTWTLNSKRWYPSSVSSTAYVVASGGALAQNTLVVAKGFAVAGNNGLKVVGAASDADEIKCSGLTAEAAIPATQNATLQVCGVKTATGDLDMNSDGNLTSTALDFTTLGLTVGQMIKLGGEDSADQFTNAVNNGYARITAIAANLLSLDRASGTFVAEANTTKTVHIYFGGFIRDVAVDHASYIGPEVDALRSYVFEGYYENLADNGTDPAYEYAWGNVLNMLTLSLPLAEKASLTLEFVGTDCDPPTETRATDAANPRAVVQQAMYNTTTDIARLIVAQTDETGLSTDFKSASVKIGNNVSPEQKLGTLGGAYMNSGDLDVSVDMEVLFTNRQVLEHVRENDSVGMWLALKNDDGGFGIDIPKMCLESPTKGFPENASMTLSLTGVAEEDDTYGHLISFSDFPYLP